ncbi:MAG: restriction endonuclease subunit S [Sulfurovum sp.]|nr:restriction endonuclease subunit S [Sulfurovum sp.]
MADYKYIRVPKQISLTEYEQNGYCLAPSKYSRFLPCDTVNYMSLDELCTESKKKISFSIKNEYYYSEIGDIDVTNGGVNHSKFYGINLPSENPKELKQGDIVISTVRTYRGGIGFIYDNLENHCCSPAILVIRDVSKKITKEYLLSVLRTDFFIEQISGFLNRGMYPRLDKEAMKHILIPIPKSNEILRYITLLTKAYLNKIATIKKRHETIFDVIENELISNQKPNKFKFELPTIKEIEEVGRLDTGIYTEQFKRIKFLIQNYTNNFFFIDKNKIKSGSTPEVRFIGNIKALKNRWVTPTHCSDFGTVTEERINIEGNNNINEDCILLINRTSKGGIGEFVGIAGYYNYTEFGQGHHNQGMYRVFNYSKDKLLFMLCFLNCSLMRKYCAGLSVGSKMKELKIEQFLQIPFPNFPEAKQKEISLLYHNPTSNYEIETFTLDNFLEQDNAFNETAGIFELDKTAKQLKEILNKAIDDIANDKEVNITFYFAKLNEGSLTGNLFDL